MASESAANPAPARPLGERLLLAALLLGVGDLAGKVLAFIITIIRTRSLSAAEFGAFGFILQTIGMFAQVAGFSLGMAATRYVALYRESDPPRARQIAQFITSFGLVTNFVAAGLLFVLAPYLAGDIPGLIEPLRWSTLILASQTLSGLFLGLLAGLERFRAVTIAVFVQNVVMLALTAWWAPIWGLTGTILAMSAGFAITLALALWHCRDLVGGPWANSTEIWAHRRILIDFCIPSLLGGLIILPANWLSTAIIATRHGPIEPLLAALIVVPPCWLVGMGLAHQFASGLRQVGLFTAADQFRPMLNLLANLVAQPMMPLVTAQIHKAHSPDSSDAERGEARRKALRGIERSFQLAACLILPAHACFAFAAPYIMALFGRSFAADWNVFLVVLAWGAMAGMVSLIGIALYAQGRIWMQNAFLVVYGLVLVAVTWCLQEWGGLGLAFGQLTATLSTFALGSVILLRTGYLSLRGITVHLLAMGWMLILSLLSAWIPSASRILAIPLAVGITMLMLFLLQKSETYYVLRLLRQKLRLVRKP